MRRHEYEIKQKQKPVKQSVKDLKLWANEKRAELVQTEENLPLWIDDTGV